jgi:hypothetical protein
MGKVKTGKEKAEVHYVSNDKEMLHAYHMREMAKFDYATAWKTAYMKGWEEGLLKGILKRLSILERLKEGELEKLLESLKEWNKNIIARDMKANSNMSASQISKYTGLSIDEIERF